MTAKDIGPISQPLADAAKENGGHGLKHLAENLAREDGPPVHSDRIDHFTLRGMFGGFSGEPVWVQVRDVVFGIATLALLLWLARLIYIALH
jgi:hypothetical protein